MRVISRCFNTLIKRFDFYETTCVGRGNSHFPGSPILSENDWSRWCDDLIRVYFSSFPVSSTSSHERQRVHRMFRRVALTTLSLIPQLAAADGAGKRIAILSSGEIVQVSKLCQVGDTIVCLENREWYVALRPSDRTTSPEEKSMLKKDLLDREVAYLWRDLDRKRDRDPHSEYWIKSVERSVFNWANIQSHQIEDWYFVAVGNRLHGDVKPHVDSVNGLLWEEWPFYSLRPNIFAIH